MRCYELSQHNILSLTTKWTEKREVRSQESRFKGQPVINYGPLSLTIRNKLALWLIRKRWTFLKFSVGFTLLFKFITGQTGKRTHTTKNSHAGVSLTHEERAINRNYTYLRMFVTLESSPLFRLVSGPKRDLFYVKTQAISLSSAVAHYIPNKISFFFISFR